MRWAKVISVGLPIPAKASDPVEHQVQQMEKTLNALRPYSPDFVCFSEICIHLGRPLKQAISYAQTLPGPATERLAVCSKAMNAYVLVPLLESDSGRIYNTAALLDPQGKLVGEYRKFMPTSYEMADGVYPGADVPVWETTFGRVGAAICFDLKFPEVGLALSRGRAQLVLWPTMFQGGRRLASWARDYGFHIISCGVWGGQVVDPRGQVIAECTVPTELPGVGLVNLTQARVNLDCKTYHLDYNRQKLPKLLAKYGHGISVDLMEPEGTFTLTSSLPDRTIDEIEVEFGLEDLRNYLDRAMRDRAERLS